MCPLSRSRGLDPSSLDTILHSDNSGHCPCSCTSDSTLRNKARNRFPTGPRPRMHPKSQDFVEHRGSRGKFFWPEPWVELAPGSQHLQHRTQSQQGYHIRRRKGSITWGTGHLGRMYANNEALPQAARCCPSIPVGPMTAPPWRPAGLLPDIEELEEQY